MPRRGPRLLWQQLSPAQDRHLPRWGRTGRPVQLAEPAHDPARLPTSQHGPRKRPILGLAPQGRSARVRATDRTSLWSARVAHWALLARRPRPPPLPCARRARGSAWPLQGRPCLNVLRRPPTLHCRSSPQGPHPAGALGAGSRRSRIRARSVGLPRLGSLAPRRGCAGPRASSRCRAGGGRRCTGRRPWHLAGWWSREQRER